MSQGNGSFRLAQPRNTSVVEAIQNLHLADDRQDFAHRLIESDPPLLYQLHGSGRCDRLGHRSDSENGIGRHRGGLIDRSPSESALVEDAILIGRKRHNTRNQTGIDGFSEDRINPTGSRSLGCSLLVGHAAQPTITSGAEKPFLDMTPYLFVNRSSF